MSSKNAIARKKIELEEARDLATRLLHEEYEGCGAFESREGPSAALTAAEEKVERLEKEYEALSGEQLKKFAAELDKASKLFGSIIYQVDAGLCQLSPSLFSEAERQIHDLKDRIKALEKNQPNK